VIFKLLIICGASLSVSLAAAEATLREHAWALVDEPNNRPESQTGWGCVPYPFEIGRFEITNAQYAQFLNAVAQMDDPCGLWHQNQADGPMGFIYREKTDRGFRYTVSTGAENLPVVYVSWYSAARFCNWLHRGQPDANAEPLSATEGTAVEGAYDTRSFPSALHGQQPAALLPFTHNSHARYWLPSVDEWIKAGFYVPHSGGRYSRYATGSDRMPIAESPPGGKNSANFYARGWAVPYPHLTNVGSYPQATSAYGTFDQAGNVMEWLETTAGSERTKRRFTGGAAARYSTMLALNYSDWDDADLRLMTVGFRIARAVSEIGHELRAVAVLSATPSLAPTCDPARKSPVHSGFEFVLIGQPDNRPDPIYECGHVDYAFEIGRFEVTNADYATFLNAVARRADPFALYESSMGDGVLGGIARESTSSGYAYRAKPGWENRPVTYLNWYRLARLANWLDFGRPDTGDSRLGTTEATTSIGAYDTRAFPAPDSDVVEPARLPSRRNPGARYWIPNQDEWFKAAYYDPTRPGSRPYWNYPVRADVAPNNLAPPGDAHSVNYLADNFCVGMPFVVTEVGAFPAAASYFGTYDQGGNVWEWLESWREPPKSGGWRATETVRTLRGGSATYSALGIHAANVDPGHPNHALAVYGGRLARRALGTKTNGNSPPDFYETIP
jgi:formylglycine-generating enzyme required for sulfatase activity